MSQAPGWYSDPFARDQERYWDGSIWTQGIRPLGGTEGAPGRVAESDAAALARESSLAPPASAVSPERPDLQTVVSRAVDSAWGTPRGEAPSYAPLGAPIPPVIAQPSGGPASWASPTTGPAHAAKRNPQRHRASLGIGGAVLVLVAGGVSAALVMGGSSVASAQEAVASAATQSMNAQTADVSISMDISVQGVHEAVTGTGGFDFAQKKAAMSLTIPLDGPQVTVKEILDGSTVYVNVGDMGNGLPNGKTWISEDMSQLNSVSGGFGTLDPGSMLQRLQSLGGTVTSLGSTTYDGTAVTEYSATLPASALEGELGRLPSLQQSMSGVSLPDMKWDIYVTNDNLLKALTMPSYSVADGGQSVSMDMTVLFSNYGATVNVTPPPADQVEPLGDLGAASFGSFGNSGSTGDTGNSGTTF